MAVAVQLHVTSPNPIDSYDWDFGDGTSHNTSSDPYHIYADGIYQVNVSLIWTSGISGHIQKTISVNTVYDLVLEYV